MLSLNYYLKLLHKLFAYGISGSCLAWLTNFLNKRTICTRVDGALSHTVKQVSDVAQGTVLESLCFVLHINDLPCQLKNCTVKLCADDVKVYFRFTPNLWMDSLH